MSIEHLQEKLRAYAKERDWEQFHSPKNLSMGLAIEAAELMEIFQWKTTEASRSLSEKEFAASCDEIADVFTYTLLLADKLGIDLIQATEQKMIKNAEKYPAEKVKGSAKKYTEYD